MYEELPKELELCRGSLIVVAGVGEKTKSLYDYIDVWQYLHHFN